MMATLIGDQTNFWKILATEHRSSTKSQCCSAKLVGACSHNVKNESFWSRGF